MLECACMSTTSRAAPSALCIRRVADEERNWLDAFLEGHGVGSALLAAVTDESKRQGSQRLWLITTNDNLKALRFYQRRGMRIVAVHPGGVDEARLVKPTIPVIGKHGTTRIACAAQPSVHRLPSPDPTREPPI
jgi:Acetyltransferase (GNAT) family